MLTPGKGKIILESKLGRWHQWWNCHPMSFLTPGDLVVKNPNSLFRKRCLGSMG
jgi:hypothetical protein